MHHRSVIQISIFRSPEYPIYTRKVRYQRVGLSLIGAIALIVVVIAMAIVCIVGETLRSDPSLFARAVTALEGVPLRLVSQAASRRNITFVMRDSDVPRAMNRLHDAFFATV